MPNKISESPLVTVCITTYNRKDLLPYTIMSVLQQTYSNFEIIVVDDCSSDNTYEAVRDLVCQHQNVTYIRHHENKGLAAARNTAIFNAKGKYFTFIDDDDQWSIHFLHEFVAFAENYDDKWCFCCGLRYVDESGGIHYSMTSFDGRLVDYCKQGFTPPVASQFYFLSSLIKINGYNEAIKSGVDHDLWLKLAFNEMNIKSLEKYLSYPDSNGNRNRKRITNQYDKRIQGITNFLAFWKEDIVKHLGAEFYTNFHNAYLIKERKKFFVKSISNYQFNSACKIYRQIPKNIGIKDILKGLMIAFSTTTKIEVKRERHVCNNKALKIIQT